MRKFDVSWFDAKLHETRQSQRAFSDALDIDKATAHNILRGKRPLKLEEIEGVAKFLNTTTYEVLMKAGINVKGFPDNAEPANENTLQISEVSTKGGLGDAQIAEWGIPSNYLDAYLDVDAASTRVIVVQGDSMEPTLRSGDRVMLDIGDTTPSPAGLFAIWDGIGISIKRIEAILNSSPLTLKIQSDSDLTENVTAEAADVKIIGRVVWSARKM